MAIIVTEKMQSRPSSLGENAGCDLLYTIKGTADDAEARAALMDAAPATYYGLPVQNGEVRPVFVDISNPDGSIWDGTAHYARKQDQERKVGDQSYEFDTTGGTEHVTQSKETMGLWSSEGPCDKTWFGHAIGVTPDGVEGADIVSRVYRWSETHILDKAEVTEAYKDKLFMLTGTVNNAEFRGKAQGSVLFLGVRGGARGDDDVELTFNFAASRNMTLPDIPSKAHEPPYGDAPITGVYKRGWEYLWILYVDSETAHGLPTKLAVCAATERVYEYSDFSQLGIGTEPGGES
jgi:hypothetical protein